MENLGYSYIYQIQKRKQNHLNLGGLIHSCNEKFRDFGLTKIV